MHLIGNRREIILLRTNQLYVIWKCQKSFSKQKPFCFCRFYDMHERMHVLDGQCLSLSYVFLFCFFCFENSSRCKTSLWRMSKTEQTLNLLWSETQQNNRFCVVGWCMQMSLLYLSLKLSIFYYNCTHFHRFGQNIVEKICF